MWKASDNDNFKACKVVTTKEKWGFSKLAILSGKEEGSVEVVNNQGEEDDPIDVFAEIFSDNRG